MPLSYTGIATGSIAKAAQLTQVLDLFLGTMTDQTVTFGNTLIVKGSSANGFTVGVGGTTNPVFNIVTNTASQIAGLQLTGAATGGTVALVATDSGATANLSINAKGSGTISINGTATGAITLGRATTITTGGLTVTAGNVGIGAANATNIGLTVAGSTTSGSTSEYGIGCDPTFSSGATTAGTAFYAKVVTTAAAFTMTSGIGLEVDTPVIGAGSAITNVRGIQVDVQSGGGTTNVGVYINTPTGTGARVIDTVSGAFLSTAGAWTNNPSWRSYKSDVRYVERDELAGIYDWFVSGWKPARYRHEGIALHGDGPAPVHQQWEYDSFFALLDDMPENVRDIICVDQQGGISTKDTDGLLFALVLEQGKRLKELESRLAT